MASPQTRSQDNLQQALAEFKAELPEEHLKNLEATAADTKDDYRSVMYLTTALDVATRKHIGESLAPRLVPFLCAIKDYAAVLDTLAQSSSIAALVWGSVKLCLLLTSNWALYFRAVTGLLSKVGKISSKFSDFGSLFPSSQGLQDALNHYHAVIIRMCCKAVRVSKRPGWQQIPRKAFKNFERDYEPLQHELEQCAAVVNAEISLATEEQRRKEHADNALTTQNVEIMVSDQQFEQLYKSRSKVKSNLSKSNPRSAWTHVQRQCIPFTSSWFENSQAFTAWRDETTSSALVYSERIGSGKTMLSANIIEALVQIEGSHYRIGYCLCQMLDTNGRSARNVLGSITRQLLERVIDASTSSTLLDLLDQSASGEVDTIAELLNKYLPEDRQVYIVLDGMDELEHHDMLRILQVLSDLVHFGDRSNAIKVFITSRSDSKKVLEALNMKGFELLPTKEDLEESFNEFIAATIRKKIRSEQLDISQFQDDEIDDLVGAILHAVLEGSQGMALWAKLLIERLCTTDNRHDLLAALDDTRVPVDLAEIYDKILVRLEANEAQRKQLVRMFTWTIGARRMMTTSQLRMAIAIEYETTELNEYALPSMGRLIHATGGLIYLDQDNDTVHLVHSSLGRHLCDREEAPTLHKDKHGSIFCFQSKDIDRELFKICQTYLDFPEFKRSMERQEPTPRGLDLGRRGTIQLEDHPRGVTVVAKATQILKRFGRPSHEDATVQLSADALTRLRSARPRSSSTSNGELLGYVADNWVHHGGMVDTTADIRLWSDFKALVSTSNPHVSKLWEVKYGNMDALEARAYASAPHTPSGYFSTARFSQSVLKGIKWSFEHNNPALLKSLDSKPGAKLGQKKEMKHEKIANLLSTILNLMAFASEKDIMSKALRELLAMIDPESSEAQVVSWYASSLFNEPQHQVFPPSGWRRWSTTSEYLDDIFSIPRFVKPELRLSRTGGRNKLGDFSKHQVWKNFNTDTRVHPLTLAAILDHRRALSWGPDALDNEDRTDPFDAVIEPFDFSLDALYFAVLSGREECCNILLRVMKQEQAPPARGSEARLVRIARTILWSQLRGYRDVARRLLDVTLPVYGRGILVEVIHCTDDAANSLLFYLIEVRDFDMLASLLLTLDGEKLGKPPTTATNSTLSDYARAFLEEMNLENDRKAAAALRAIEDLEDRTSSPVVNDSTRARSSPMTELRRLFTHAPTTDESYDSDTDEEDTFHDTMSPEEDRERRHFENPGSTISLDLTSCEGMTALQEPPATQITRHASSTSASTVANSAANVGNTSTDTTIETGSLGNRSSALQVRDEARNNLQINNGDLRHYSTIPSTRLSPSQGAYYNIENEQPTGAGLGITSEHTPGHGSRSRQDALQNTATIETATPLSNTESTLETLDTPTQRPAASEQDCLHASAGAQQLEARLNGGSPQLGSDSPNMQQRRNTGDTDARI